MVKYDEAFLATGCKTIDEYVESFYDHKSLFYTTKNVRKEYCDKCRDIFKTCDGCFIHDGLQAIYKINPFA